MAEDELLNYQHAPKNQHSLGTLTGAVRETRLRGAKDIEDIEILYLIGLKGFPFHARPD